MCNTLRSWFNGSTVLKFIPLQKRIIVPLILCNMDNTFRATFQTFHVQPLGREASAVRRQSAVRMDVEANVVQELAY